MKITKDHVGMTGTITAEVTIADHALYAGKFFTREMGWLPVEAFDFTPDPVKLPTGLGARIRLDSGLVFTRLSADGWASTGGALRSNDDLTGLTFTVLFEGDTRTEASDV